MNTLTVMILAALVALVSSQACTATTCATCVTDSGCGWCGATQSCHNGSALGPNIPTKCFGGSWQTGECDACSSVTTGGCRACLEYGGCCWDSTNMECVALSTTGSCEGGCPCEEYRNCADCTAIGAVREGCQWCDDDQTCSSQCSGMTRHSCDCRTFTDCDTCESANGCVWCQDAATGLGLCQTESDPQENCLDESCAASCARFSFSCDLCLATGGCAWCSETNTCVNAGSSNGCLLAHTCGYQCPLLSDRGCETCLQNHWCGYCEELELCFDRSVPPDCPFLVYNCANEPLPQAGFSTGSFIGGMFFMMCLTAAAIGGFIFYRKREETSVYDAAG